jgi:multidrug efflux pump subunit AcrB
MSTAGSNIPPIMTYSINASSSSMYIKEYAENNIVPKLSMIEGVNHISLYGATPYEWEIKFKISELAHLGLKGNDISNAIRNYFRRDRLGMVQERAVNGNEKLLAVSLQSNFKDEVDWSKIPIKKMGERLLYLTDVATLRHKEKQPTSYFRINGLNSINMVIYPEKSINTIDLAKKLRNIMEELKEQLPNGFSFMLAHDSTKYVEKDLNRIAKRTFFSVLILLLFVLGISKQVRYLLLILISLFANVSIAIIFYTFFDLEVHLYSLAGITISLGFIIDSSIVMIDHIRFHNNKKAFLAILGATLTTIGSLSIIFFLKEQQKLDLIDFSSVIIINLSVSLVIALFLIPALMEKIHLYKSNSKNIYKTKKRNYKLSRFYASTILFGKRFKWLYITVLILGFGLPVHWLPEEIEGEGFWAEIYNNTLGSSFYQDDIKPWADKILGGSLRLFTEDVFESSFYASPAQTKLTINGKMPEGCTIDQLNASTMKMENFLSQFDEIEMFQTRIHNYRSSSISVTFKPEFEFGDFPYQLKEKVVHEANNMGGLSWGVYGVGKGFNNSMGGYNFGSNEIKLEGYNYDKLYSLAEDLAKKLKKNPRVRKVEIAGKRGWNTENLVEFFIDFDKEQFGANRLSLYEFYSYLKDQTYKSNLPPVFVKGEKQNLSLVSDKAKQFNVWDLKNNPILFKDKSYKLKQLANVDKARSGNSIHKNNQQYNLSVMFDFLGSYALAKRVKKRQIKRLKEELPIGYSVREGHWNWWNKDEKTQYYLLLLIIAIIYFICAIIFESLTQPLVIISMIPISFIGVFLTFYMFEFNFDQGGFASFILLCGIVVNAGLYIINDFNIFKKRANSKSNFSLYLKAFNNKIIPIFLTIISTVLGLVPFVWSGQNEVFWFSFAVGSMGGLLFSFVAITVYLPMFLKIRN